MIPDRILQQLPALVLALCAIAAIVAGRAYDIGTLTRMGPGFMPVLVGVLLLALALAQMIGSWREIAPPAIAPGLRALALCTGSILVWALLAERAGVIPASVPQLLLAHFAVPQASWKPVLALAVIVSTLAYIVFVVLLGVPLRAFG